jgi:hypothetical protein
MGNGGGVFSSIMWRVAEVTPTNRPAFVPGEPRKYEIETVWQSPEITRFTDSQVIPQGVVKIGHLYRVRSRVKDSAGRWSHWSNPIEFQVGEPDNYWDLRAHLRITEIMYQPTGTGEFEYLELMNTSADLSLNLGGTRFTQGIDYLFPEGTILPPQGRLLLVKTIPLNNFASFREHYGLGQDILILGPYAGSLSNSGETLTLRSGAAGQDVLSVKYNNGRDWPQQAAGAGHSLIAPLLLGSYQSAENTCTPSLWQASAFINGSPGSDESSRTTAVLINEIAANTGAGSVMDPLKASCDWIELFNPSSNTVSLVDCYLSDDPLQLNKWAIPLQSLSSYGFAAFDETNSFHLDPTNGFGLSHNGETLYLSQIPTNGPARILDAVKFPCSTPNSTWGRYPDGGTYWSFLPPTENQPNTAPSRHVCITEVMYHPKELVTAQDNVTDEFVEIHNPTDLPIDLDNPMTELRVAGDISFDLYANATLGTNEFLLLVNFNPTNQTLLNGFRSRLGVQSTNLLILGPYQGKLPNNDGTIRIEASLPVDDTGTNWEWIVVDEVLYSSQAPWDSAADATGLSLQRISNRRPGSMPANWLASTPTPGVINTVLEPQETRFTPIAFTPGQKSQWMLTTPCGTTVVLLHSTDLLNWIPVLTNNIPNGSTNFTFDLGEDIQGFFRTMNNN